MDLPATAAKVSRTLLSVRDMKGADNIIAFGLNSNHVIVDKNTGKTIATGGKDLIVNKVSGSRTDIIDTGKDYVMNIWIRKPKGSLNEVKFNNVGHGIWKKSNVVNTNNRYSALDDSNVYSTF